jgi:hypothetical protein
MDVHYVTCYVNEGYVLPMFRLEPLSNSFQQGAYIESVRDYKWSDISRGNGI